LNTTKASRSIAVDAGCRAHLVPLRYGQEIKGIQLRIGDGGPGYTKHFSTKRYGGEEGAVRAATNTAKSLGLVISKTRPGPTPGRRQANNKTGEPGIQFLWRNYETPVLAVVATWVDTKTSRPKSTSYSVEINGLEGALDKAIAARNRSGVPVTTKKVLLRNLRSTYKAGSA